MEIVRKILSAPVGAAQAAGGKKMHIRVMTVLMALGFVLAIAIPAWSGDVEPPHYFGSGTGYKDFGSSKYFYSQYPPEKWDAYGYGTGHMGMGYGPYIYGGRGIDRTALERSDYGIPTIVPKLKWMGGTQVRVRIPVDPLAVVKMRVDVLAFNGAVLETAADAVAPFEIVTDLPQGSATVRVHVDLADSGFSATAFPIVPTK